MPSRVRIVLAEDHPHVRLQLRLLLEKEADFELVAEAADGVKAVQLARDLKPDLLISDLIMPGLHGLDVARQVLDNGAAIRIIIISVNLDEPYVALALRLGVAGYVYKNSCTDCLVTAVRTVQAGARYLSPPLEQALLEATPETSGAERSLLRYTAAGVSDAEIGQSLGLTKAGVETLRTKIMERLGLADLNALMDYVRLNGWSPR